MLELFYRKLAYINIYGAISLNLDDRKFYRSTIKEIFILRKTNRNVKKTDYQGMGLWQFTITKRPPWTVR